MFYHISGTLTYTDLQTAVVECGGIGFKCFTPLSTLRALPGKGSKVTLFTYLYVREDTLDLFGFASEQELECFKLLLSVSGVGPKVAIAILSDFTPDKILLCIASGDSKTLTKAAGVGAKLAQRILLELKDKVAGLSSLQSADTENISLVSENSNIQEAALALTSLGYTQSDAILVLSKLDAALPVEGLITNALKLLSRQV